MVKDPYAVLGISKTATPEEIKSAYRKMAKKYHPDLHPDDAQAALKMNEVNEAYDMLTHPEKYEQKRREEEARQGYGSYYGANRSSGSSYQGSSNSAGGYSNRQGSGYTGAGGWYSDFGGFEDFFNFGGYQTGGSDNINPHEEAGDPPEFRQAITYINSGRYREAVQILMQVTHYGRNARWYYLNALALYGYGDNTQAADYMTKAVQMEPNNTLYHQLLSKFRQEGQTYYRSTTVVSPFRRIGRIILVIIILQMLFRLLASFMYMGGGIPYM